jgi:hypothetical protein
MAAGVISFSQALSHYPAFSRFWKYVDVIICHKAVIGHSASRHPAYLRSYRRGLSTVGVE